MNCKLFLFFVLIFFICTGNLLPTNSLEGISHFNKIIDGKIALEVIKIDLAKGISVFSVLPAEGVGNADNFETMVKEVSADAAINGCYFCTKTNILTSSIIVGGKEIAKGAFKPTFAIDNNDNPVISDRNEIDKNWDKYKMAISCIDVLIKDGKQVIQNEQDLIQAGHTPNPENHIFHSNPQSAIGINKNKKLVYFISTPGRIKIYEFAKIILENFEVSDVMGLDGGGSVGIYYNGEIKIKPKRKIPAIITAKRMKIKK